MIIVARRSLAAVVVLLCLACAGTARGKRSLPVTPDLSRIDHLVLGIDDLQRGVAELERQTGVRAVFGGAHPGRGTQNALMSLGDHHYLEIVAPNPAEAGNPEAAELGRLTALTPVGWAVHSDDLEALQQSLRGRGPKTDEIRPGGRNLPDGSRLTWKTLSFAPSASPLLPFFIEWGQGAAHPSATSPGGCRLTGFVLEDPAPDALRQSLRDAGLPTEVREGKEPRIRISLACPKGNVEI